MSTKRPEDRCWEVTRLLEGFLREGGAAAREFVADALAESKNEA
jgi:hypothetical protein